MSAASYQDDFIRFLIASGALTFGDFTTKSGRETPYFINTGRFDDGGKIHELGGFYAKHIVASALGKIDVIFGPAYKGIPLCVAAASALYWGHGIKIGFSFDRKEEKQHGDKGRFVGRAPRSGDRVVIVEDVITAGTTLKEIVPKLRALDGVEIAAVVISVDRRERGAGDMTAVEEVESELGIKVLPIVDIQRIIEFLKREPGLVEGSLIGRIESYLAQYGKR